MRFSEDGRSGHIPFLREINTITPQQVHSIVNHTLLKLGGKMRLPVSVGQNMRLHPYPKSSLITKQLSFSFNETVIFNGKIIFIEAIILLYLQ